jgi:hypothetical protein
MRVLAGTASPGRNQERDVGDQVDVAGSRPAGTYSRLADVTRLGESRDYGDGDSD